MPTEMRSGPKDSAQGKDIRVACSVCDRQTVHSVVRSAEYTDHYEEHDFSVTGWDSYQIVECKGCQEISFRHVSSNTEDLDHDPATGNAVLHETVQIYPHRLPGRSGIRDSYRLPPSVHRAYQESLQALRVGMPVLAGVGMRAIVETVCRDRGARGNNLEKQLDSLVGQGVLTSAGAEILHSLRIMGNKAAHEVKPHTVAELTTAMDVVEHTLQGIYILPKQAAQLPKRLKTSGKGRPHKE